MNVNDYNLLAIVVAAAVGVGIGLAWFAPPVLGGRWQKETGVTSPGARPFVIWCACYLLLSVTVAYVFRHMGVSGLGGGLRWGSTLGSTLVLAAMAPNYAFGRRSLTQFAIEGGYVFVALTVMGAILGAWQG